MSITASLCLAVAVAAPPMALEATREGEVLHVSFSLLAPLPDAINEALPSGAAVRVRYPLRVRSPRRLWWDRKVWKGEVVTVVVFDPITGRYRGDVVLDGVVVTSRELATAEAAREFLANPGPILLRPPPGKRAPPVRVKVRAIFASSTVWLFFPSIDGTEWVEVEVPQPEAEGPGPEAAETGPSEPEAADSEAIE
jgi:hypothetical protein